MNPALPIFRFSELPADTSGQHHHHQHHHLHRGLPPTTPGATVQKYRFIDGDLISSIADEDND